MNRIAIGNVKDHLIVKVEESSKASVRAIEHKMSEKTIEMWADMALLYGKLLKWITLAEKGQLLIKGYVVVEECHKPSDCEGTCEFCVSNGFVVEEKCVSVAEIDTSAVFLSIEDANAERDKRNRERGLLE